MVLYDAFGVKFLIGLLILLNVDVLISKMLRLEDSWLWYFQQFVADLIESNCKARILTNL